MGPIVTRGVLLDVLGQKLAAGEDVIEPAANGQPVLTSNYRITIDDLEAAMEHGRIRSLEPGDAVMIRTGWNQLLDRSNGDFVRRRSRPVGRRHRNARYLPGRGPLAGDASAGHRRQRHVGARGPRLVVERADVLFPCHQELLMRHGIRIAESVVLDALADAGVYEYVHIVTPQFAKGATAGNTPPAGLGVVR